MRAYVVHFTGKDGSKCSAAIDLITHPRCSREQATSNAIASVIAAKGSGWIADFKVHEVE